MQLILDKIEDFKEFIDKDYYYVDKSDFIETVFQDKVTLFTRPRRFGKTLNMSMLYYFLSNEERENAYLFNDLKISYNQNIMKHQNQYPVIFITFKDLKNLDFHSQIEKFSLIISRKIKEYSELRNSPFLNESEKKMIRKYDYGTLSKVELENALLNISIYLSKHYHKKAVILIDEYDVPLQSAYLHDCYDEMSNFLGNVLSAALKTNDALEKGVLTGCLRIAKESIFTGLNNFSVYSIFNKGQSSTHFGFTQNEIDTLLKYYHIEKYRENIKNWYDGYLFGNTEIYNPWSTLNYVKQIIQENDIIPVSYWANTSGNDIVYQYIKNGDSVLKDEFECLVQGRTIIKTIQPELTYREMADVNHIYSFLLFTGYLKIKDYVYDDHHDMIMNTYELVIPNKEVKLIFENQFKSYFENYTKNRKQEFVEALRCEDVTKANEILNDILNHSISFYDNYEAFYHGFMMGLLSEYRTLLNRENGRFDIGIIPDSIMKNYIVIECKKANKLSLLIKESENAVHQIINQHYIEGIENEGYMNVIGYGISFFEKNCWITKVEK